MTLQITELDISNAPPTAYANTVRACLNVARRHSGLVLQVAGTSSGADITQQPDADTAAQQWRVTEHGDGAISLVNRHSGLAMDVWGASTADGARISQWNHTGNANQRFPLQRG